MQVIIEKYTKAKLEMWSWSIVAQYFGFQTCLSRVSKEKNPFVKKLLQN